MRHQIVPLGGLRGFAAIVFCLAAFIVGVAAPVPSAAQTLTFLIDNQSGLDGIKGVAALAEQKLGISITIDLRPGGAEGDNIVKTRLATGDMDDLSFYNSGSLFQALNPPQNFVDLTDEPFMKDVLDSFKQTVSVNGRVYGIPAQTAMGGGWLYNKKVYAQLGLKVPRTWSELLANCDRIKASGKVPVIGSYKDDWTSQLIFLADYYNVQAKDPSFAADYTAHRATIAGTPVALRSFEKLQEIYKRGYMNKDLLATTFEQALKMLADGSGAQYPMLTFAVDNIKNIAPDKVADIGFFPQPGDSASSNGITAWMPAGIYLYKNGSNVDAAKKWAGFFVSKEGLAAYMEKQTPTGPFLVRGVKLPANVVPVANDMLPYFDSGRTAPALEFVSPIKGPNLPQICVQVGSGIMTPLDAARQYDKDVEKQAKQLGLPGW